jgi:uncharacterized protein (UPF0333 family)
MRNKKGQSILEYVIVLTVIVAAVAIAATSYIKPGIQKSIENVNASIVNASGRLPGVPAGS